MWIFLRHSMNFVSSTPKYLGEEGSALVPFLQKILMGIFLDDMPIMEMGGYLKTIGIFLSDFQAERELLRAKRFFAPPLNLLQLINYFLIM